MVSGEIERELYKAYGIIKQ